MPDSDGSTQVRRCLFCDAPIVRKPKEWPSHTRDRIFCGHKCRAAMSSKRARDARGDEWPKPCQHCGALFDYNYDRELRWNRRARWCNLACTHAALHAKALLDKQTRRVTWFWENVDKSGGPDACWPWTGRLRHKRGYGRMYGGVGEGMIGCHRFAYERTHGAIPEGMQVCHKCDNPPCCNPSHLFIGTLQDNLADMVAKGRNTKGERVGNSKLKEHEVIFIRKELARGVRIMELARRFNCSHATISLIRSGKNWKHLL